MLYTVAEKHNSQALEADALHFSTDIWSSAVVIAGLGLVWLGERLGPDWAWLAQADAVAALVVALIVIYVSLQLGKRAVAVLLDAAPAGLAERIGVEAGRVPGVHGVGPVRVRQAGASTFADLTVRVARSTSLEEAHQVASAVEARIAAIVHQGDVVVHVDPVQPAGESLPQAVGAVAARLGLRAHNIHAHEVRGHYYVDLHAEVPPEWTLAEAHDRVSRLEEALRRELPHVDGVQTHIEPRGVPLTTITHEAAPDEQVLVRIVTTIVDAVPGLRGCHDVQLRASDGGYDVSLHCVADPAMPVSEVHHLADEAERRIQAEVPGVSEVLVHVEPEGEA
jgi:divalent metal cation (Fe/Co/Zn/Cd) transporter